MWLILPYARPQRNQSLAEPLDEQPEVLAGQHGAVVFGVPLEPGQRLADRRAPERQLAVVMGGRDIDDDP
jgi:hypothetical protein